MPGVLRSFHFRTIILALIALPLIALISVTSWIGTQYWQTASEMQRLHALTKFASSTSALIHELQKERGMSAAFIGSGGESSLVEQLDAQRSRTDHQVDAFDEAVEVGAIAAYQALATELQEFRGRIARLGDERALVDGQRRDIIGLTSYYSVVIGNLLGLIDHMAATSGQAEVATAIDSYTALLHAKERAGLERAMGAVGFAKGRFFVYEYRRLVDLIGRQEAFLEVFSGTATAGQLEFYQQTMSGPVIAEMKRLRRIAIDSPFNADLENISEVAWFEAATERIDLLKLVEDRLSTDLLTLTDDLQTRARSRFWLIVAVLSALVVTVTVLSAILARHARQPLEALASMIRETGSDASLNLPGLDRGDEVGELARAFEGQELAKQELERANRELERSNRELDDFAYIASHDLKEPLRAMHNHASFLLEDNREQLDESGEKRLIRIMHLSARMERLIADLLYFSRLGRGDQSMTAIDLNGVIANIESDLAETLRERNARINVPEHLPSISGHPAHITALFQNLISNGVKYNDAEEKTIEIGLISVEPDDEANSFDTLYVRDNGIGIDKKFQNEIFRIFKRLNSEKTYGEGTGAGLTFVKKIVENHGGRLWLESELGGGTTFFFTLPSEGSSSASAGVHQAA